MTVAFFDENANGNSDYHNVDLVRHRREVRRERARCIGRARRVDGVETIEASGPRDDAMCGVTVRVARINDAEVADDLEILDEVRDTPLGADRRVTDHR